MRYKKTMLIGMSILVALILICAIVFGISFHKKSLIEFGYGDSPNSANQGSIKNINRYELWDVYKIPVSVSKKTPDAYDEIISNIIASYPWNDNDLQIVPEISELSYMYRRHSELSEIGYALIDLDSDGQQELILSDINSPYIYDLYTITDGKAMHLFDSGERYKYYLYANGNVELQWSGSATTSGRDFYKLSKGKLEFIERVTIDAYHAQKIGVIDSLSESNKDNYFFKSNSENEEDYENISADEAGKIIDSYQNSYNTLHIEYIPLSEYQN